MNGIFAHTIESRGASFKHARGISERSGKEFHVFHEIIYFLGGEAEFISEKLHMHLQPKTLILIPRETYHQMVIHGDPQSYYRCLLQFSADGSSDGTAPEELTEIRAIRGDGEIDYLMGKLTEAARLPNGGSPGLLRSVLTILLPALRSKQEIEDRESAQNEVIRQAVYYINRNIRSKILVSDVAAACNVSESTLAHMFKKEMNIPLHKFIVKKRLINAYHRISGGQSATAAALECGFCDYSGFYRQYKKAFGFPPSQKQNE